MQTDQLLCCCFVVVVFLFCFFYAVSFYGVCVTFILCKLNIRCFLLLLFFFCIVCLFVVVFFVVVFFLYFTFSTSRFGNQPSGDFHARERNCHELCSNLLQELLFLVGRVDSRPCYCRHSMCPRGGWGEEGGGNFLYGIVWMCVPIGPLFQRCQVYDWPLFSAKKDIFGSIFLD